ncbi:MAG: TfoX/Sxy family protein [Opitutae bacterium]|nr:TfoX/Sxy family protein [Opitutae bacterium]
MPYDEVLAARVAGYFTAKKIHPETKRMMGGLVFMVRGKMCVGVESDRLMARIDPAAYDDALRRPGCKPMDFTGRPMRGYVFVDRSVLRTESQLASWLSLALTFNPRAQSSRRKR